MMNSGMSAADVAVLSGATNRGCNDGYGFGGDGWGWIWILLIFGIFNGGWGNGFGGWGGNGVNGSGFQGYATRSDINEGFAFNTLQRDVDAIQHGICDSTYALTNAINSGFSTAELSRCNQQAALMQQLNNIQFQNQDCCCQTQRALERGFADVNYNMATQACDTRNTIQNTTRDILENNNSNTRAILDFLTQDKIASLQAENQTLKFQASQSAQNAFITANQEAQTAELIRRLGADCPVPSYIVPNPHCCYGYGYGAYGTAYNSGCGCNSGCC